ncbi:hypothetical protein GLOTRDRAFT_128694 [Gloeophyllum trabeum ATCC 11539]|uniref:Carbohydrate-binding module family 19 domain-containing protein n=1 Tax=Gloeophyllum trabeum (strain ATCC 11539 / FP-39264 / Madison 617) TaxID=670483 RepID=S7QBM8_GLOTA|nr:uncharacterized protein GLOTRDRAFT_128694 [Gloeophyllum trabeum ATCC 11539]EPQ56757.1 hypothetical protein GLOTRDRAFT_128694 [Gloeophyllum trabeum ATCC 11539]
MVKVTAFVLMLSVASSASALPFTKRIAQVISHSTTKWEAASNAVGGGQQCNPNAQRRRHGTLLAAAGPCDQQNAADAMVDLAKQLNSDADMVKFAQIFAQQPRNSPTSQGVPYCQQAPKNTELNGLYQCQYPSADKTTFVGGLQVGANGMIPFGMGAPLSSVGSCPANPSGPIADGSQLTDVTSDPGVGHSTASASGISTSEETGSASDAASATASAAASATDSAAASESVAASATESAAAAATASVAASSTAAASESAAASVTASAAASTASSSSGGSFQLANGQAAQQLNAKFPTLTADSSCNEGDNACIGSSFAQCVGGKYVTTACNTAAGLTCAALTLVNSAGTSITCTTPADALARIAATGAQGGLTGSGN